MGKHFPNYPGERRKSERAHGGAAGIKAHRETTAGIKAHRETYSKKAAAPVTIDRAFIAA
jgi:hypothetical protein